MGKRFVLLYGANKRSWHFVAGGKQMGKRFVLLYGANKRSWNFVAGGTPMGVCSMGQTKGHGNLLQEANQWGSVLLHEAKTKTLWLSAAGDTQGPLRLAH